MQIIIRQESKADYEQIDRLLVEAFANDPHSDHREHILVRNLRNSAEFIPALSLVAVDTSDQVVGYIL
ncbi:MAG: GNAT family N-acetyltransferase, partial [Bacteroidales bacterium]